MMQSVFVILIALLNSTITLEADWTWTAPEPPLPNTWYWFYGWDSTSNGVPPDYTAGLNEAWVSTNGNDSSATFGTPNNGFRTIEAAVSKTTNTLGPPWIIHIGIGQFPVARSLLVSNGCILMGSGQDATEITGMFPLNSHGTTVNPMDNSQFYDLAIIAKWTSNLAAPFGSYSEAFAAEQRPFTNVYLRGVRFLGKSDNFFIYQTNGCTALFDNCTFSSGGNGWDLVATGGHSNHSFRYNYCNLHAKGPPVIGSQTRVGNLYEGTNIFNHCTIVAEDGVESTYGFEMHRGIGLDPSQPTGRLELNDCSLYTASPTGEVKDIINSVSASVIVRGVFDTNKCVGPIIVEPYAGPTFKFAPLRSVPMPQLPTARKVKMK